MLVATAGRLCAIASLQLQGRTVAGHGERWVAVSTEKFARQLLEESEAYRDGGAFEPFRGAYRERVTAQLADVLPELLRELGATHVQDAAWQGAQRWGKAFAVDPSGQPAILSACHRIVACGDFCLGSTFESAAKSGLAAADALRECLEL